eukprot:TRINITY_DN6399_c0_g1_i1.p1 TRINITY_DN6399_c0_g1~~TRINITY_DN6399_c0_g1_i1.p1  ORF type:complete len:423 (+),score=66.16 TRINITY_DN6399_c0_g1_i1:163-1431(+)
MSHTEEKSAGRFTQDPRDAIELKETMEAHSHLFSSKDKLTQDSAPTRQSLLGYIGDDRAESTTQLAGSLHSEVLNCAPATAASEAVDLRQYTQPQNTYFSAPVMQQMMHNMQQGGDSDSKSMQVSASLGRQMGPSGSMLPAVHPPMIMQPMLSQIPQSMQPRMQGHMYYQPQMQLSNGMPTFGFFAGPLPTIIHQGNPNGSTLAFSPFAVAPPGPYERQQVAAQMMQMPERAMVRMGPESSVEISHSKQRDARPVFYRNLFHSMICRFEVENPHYEGCRIYVNDNVGYSGNAKRFKKKPDMEEKALYLNAFVYDPTQRSIFQCLACKDYFENQKYFKASPTCLGKIVLIKNNAPIKVENQQFKILVKMMCCCVHQAVDHFILNLVLSDAQTDKIVYSTKVPIHVKQWRKSTQKKEDCMILLN